MIEGLQDFDFGLAQVATGLAARFFQELPAGWRVGAVGHQPIKETVRLFSDAWPVGKLLVVAFAGGDALFADGVDGDFTAALDAHGIIAGAAAVCLRADRVILVCSKTFDLQSRTLKGLLVHEMAHATAPMLPKHGPAWQSRTLHAARTARRRGDAVLADLILADAARHVAADFPGVTDALSYTVTALKQRAEDRQRFQITVGSAGGPSLTAWLAARRSAASRIK